MSIWLQIRNWIDSSTGALDLSKADANNVLPLNNTTPFTPDADYEPATKKYVDDNAGNVGTKEVDETDIADEKILQYDEDSGKMIYVTKPVAGTFEGTMDDIPDGATYVKTHNDFTDALESKLNGIAEGAEVNVKADWLAMSGDAEILNKPTIPVNSDFTLSGLSEKSYNSLTDKPTILTLGETSTDAFRGDRGKAAYDHSQVAHAPSDAQKNSDITKEEIEAKLTGEISSHSHAGGSSATSWGKYF